ncbi:putative Fe-S protein YdhL (DUF1289 family) [Glaciimonas immobilis]|uniref:Putative Fe-S protein YdhL (DUF1289 family) n=1 Tax=Glaciimonas immobilis TaxID=728004 RepID=A0A840RQS9_9BURK|nr:putative Fe-S protein YdhL (DUF1289 family) [Glaciimonas immobilis]
MQLELFEWLIISAIERSHMMSEIRQSYWFLRNLRKTQWNLARRKREYRKVAIHKKSLQLGGMTRREILDLLRCCRSKCGAKKNPVKPCFYCDF